MFMLGPSSDCKVTPLLSGGITGLNATATTLARS